MILTNENGPQIGLSDDGNQRFPPRKELFRPREWLLLILTDKTFNSTIKKCSKQFSVLLQNFSKELKMVERENEHNEDQQKLKDRMLRIVNYYDGHLGNKKLRKEFIDSSKDDGQQVTDADFERIRSELIRDGLLKKARGMGGATSLVSQDAVQQQKEEPPMTNAPTDWQRNLLVEIVKKSGHEGRIGNKKLRDEFISLEDSCYPKIIFWL